MFSRISVGSLMNGELPSLWTTVVADSESERPIMALSSITNIIKSQGNSKSKNILTKRCKYCVTNHDGYYILSGLILPALINL